MLSGVGSQEFHAISGRPHLATTLGATGRRRRRGVRTAGQQPSVVEPYAQGFWQAAGDPGCRRCCSLTLVLSQYDDWVSADPAGRLARCLASRPEVACD